MRLGRHRRRYCINLTWLYIYIYIHTHKHMYRIRLGATWLGTLTWLCGISLLDSILTARNVIPIPHTWQGHRGTTALLGALHLDHSQDHVLSWRLCAWQKKLRCPRCRRSLHDKSCARNHRSIWACWSWLPWRHPNPKSLVRHSPTRFLFVERRWPACSVLLCWADSCSDCFFAPNHSLLVCV